MKQGKVVLLLNGRYAGRKAVVIKTLDEGTQDRPYGHAIVAGIDRYPRKVTRKMGKEKLKQRNKLKPFVKVRYGSNVKAYFDYSNVLFRIVILIVEFLGCKL